MINIQVSIDTSLLSPSEIANAVITQVMDLCNLVISLQNEDIAPHRDVCGDHVHQAKTRDEFVLVNIHLKKLEKMYI